jgi:hypothetical protein
MSMVRLLENDDDLSDVVGLIGKAFGEIANAILTKAFINTAAPAEKANAADVLEQFYSAAQKLQTSREKAFNNSARRNTNGKLSLLNRLPLKEQFPAMREFSAAKAALLAISPEIGSRIVRRVAVQQTVRLNAAATVKRRLPFPGA